MDWEQIRLDPHHSGHDAVKGHRITAGHELSHVSKGAAVAGPVALYRRGGIHDVKVCGAQFLEIADHIGKGGPGRCVEMKFGLAGAGQVSVGVFQRPCDHHEIVGLEARQVDQVVGVQDRLGNDQGDAGFFARFFYHPFGNRHVATL